MNMNITDKQKFQIFDIITQHISKGKRAVKHIIYTTTKINLSNQQLNLLYKQQSFIHNFFPIIQNVNRNRILVTDESLYSVTHWTDARDIVNNMFIYLTLVTNITITDATANVGGNTIGFALHNNVFKVKSVEIDRPTCQMLQNNISQYNLSSKVDTFNRDYLTVMNRLKQDVVFFDPPWGGTNYKKATIMDLYLGTMSLSTIILQLLQNNRAKLIICKVPNNFDFNTFSIFDYIDVPITHRYKVVYILSIKHIRIRIKK
jgi:16S rRNA G966 N2-methylase RsmD